MQPLCEVLDWGVIVTPATLIREIQVINRELELLM
jgi:hypothetical protein